MIDLEARPGTPRSCHQGLQLCVERFTGRERGLHLWRERLAKRIEERGGGHAHARLLKAVNSRRFAYAAEERIGSCAVDIVTASACDAGLRSTRSSAVKKGIIGAR